MAKTQTDQIAAVLEKNGGPMTTAEIAAAAKLDPGQASPAIGSMLDSAKWKGNIRRVKRGTYQWKTTAKSSSSNGGSTKRSLTPEKVLERWFPRGVPVDRLGEVNEWLAASRSLLNK